jgi:hypothetical protein
MPGGTFDSPWIFESALLKIPGRPQDADIAGVADFPGKMAGVIAAVVVERFDHRGSAGSGGTAASPLCVSRDISRLVAGPKMRYAAHPL